MGKASRFKQERRQSSAQVVTFVPVTAPPWTPFEQVPIEVNELWLQQFMRDNNLDRAEAEKTMQHMIQRDTVWLNSRYQVNTAEVPVQGNDWKVTHLSIKRLDKMPIHDWRELQRIKNELCGPEREAVEVYPAESRMVDEANQFHLWVMPEGMTIPFGFQQRQVADGEWKQPEAFRTMQRPFEKDPA